MIGEAEATSIEAVGKAEAERMRLKASAYKQYGDAAMVSLILETLPKVSLRGDRKSTRLNSSHTVISYAVFCLKKKKKKTTKRKKTKKKKHY